MKNVEAGRSTGEFRESMTGVSGLPGLLKLRDEEVENPMESTISEMEQREADIQSDSQGDGRVLSLA